MRSFSQEKLWTSSSTKHFLFNSTTQATHFKIAIKECNDKISTVHNPAAGISDVSIQKENGECGLDNSATNLTGSKYSMNQT